MNKANPLKKTVNEQNIFTLFQTIIKLVKEKENSSKRHNQHQVFV